MKNERWQTQTITTLDIENGIFGNCFAACVASILGMKLDDVPNFCVKETWWEDFGEWLSRRGYAAIEWKSDNKISGTHNANDTLLIASGKSPRGDWSHCVVWKGNEMVFDPHPSRDGLKDEPELYLLMFPVDLTEFSRDN